jgi:hypothetical protein
MATREILENLEELASLRAYDAAKASGDKVISFEQALQEINETERLNKTSRTKGTPGTAGTRNYCP